MEQTGHLFMDYIEVEKIFSHFHIYTFIAFPHSSHSHLADFIDVFSVI